MTRLLLNGVSNTVNTVDVSITVGTVCGLGPAMFGRLKKNSECCPSIRTKRYWIERGPDGTDQER